MRYVKRILLTSTFMSLAWAGPASAHETSNPSDTPDAADSQVQAPVDHLAAARELVNKAQQTFENFVADPKMGGFRTHVGNARAIFLVL